MTRVPIVARAQAVVCGGPQEVFRVDPARTADESWIAQVEIVEGRKPFCDACGKFLAAGDRIRLVWLRDPGTKWANKRDRRVHVACLKGAS